MSRLGRSAPSKLTENKAPETLPASRRGSARDRGYSARWDRASKLYLLRNPLCIGCQAASRVEPATLTDHVIPHRGDQNLFWDQGNWQASCRWHHDVVKQALEHRYATGTISADALRLDSATALATAERLR